METGGDGGQYNTDHVLVGPGGIFAVETKTRSKPPVGVPTVRYEGEAVSVDGGPFDDGPVRQARASANRVREVIEETTGRSGVFVRPVVLFPGWYIEGSSSGREVWVLEPKALPKWLDAEQQRLSGEDVALYASRLAGHVCGG